MTLYIYICSPLSSAHAMCMVASGDPASPWRGYSLEMHGKVGREAEAHPLDHPGAASLVLRTEDPLEQAGDVVEDGRHEAVDATERGHKHGHVLQDHAQLVQHRAKHVADERRDVAEDAANEPLDILEVLYTLPQRRSQSCSLKKKTL